MEERINRQPTTKSLDRQVDLAEYKIKVIKLLREFGLANKFAMMKDFGDAKIKKIVLKGEKVIKEYKIVDDVAIFLSTIEVFIEEERVAGGDIKMIVNEVKSELPDIVRALFQNPHLKKDEDSVNIVVERTASFMLEGRLLTDALFRAVKEREVIAEKFDVAIGGTIEPDGTVNAVNSNSDSKYTVH